MKTANGSSLATTTGSSSSGTANVGSNGGRRNGRVTSRSVLLHIENDQQQQQPDLRRSNRRSSNEETMVNSESPDDLVDSSADEEVGGSGSQNNNNKDEGDSNRATTVNKLEGLTSTLDQEECHSNVGNVDEKVVTVEGLNEVRQDITCAPVLLAISSELNLDDAAKSTGDDEESITTSNVFDNKQLSCSIDKEEDLDSDQSDVQVEVDDSCVMDVVAEIAAPNLHCEHDSTTNDEVKSKPTSNLETLNAEDRAISGSSSVTPVGVCATSIGESQTNQVDELTVLEVVDESSSLTNESPSSHDQPSMIDQPTPDAACVGEAEPEVTVLDIASSPVVVIEPEAPDDVSSTGRAADGSVDGDEDDDEDDEDQRNDDSNAGSPTDSNSTTNFSLPFVSRNGVRPAQVIEVVCGNQQARLDVRLLVAGLIRASNNTTSRAPCVLVEASAAATLAAATEGETNAERPDEVPENLSGNINGVMGSRILTLTPNQFQKYSGRGTARDWKRSTRHYGASLKSLISRKILVLNPDSHGCYCNRCIGDCGLSAVEGPEDLMVRCCLVMIHDSIMMKEYRAKQG